ncbi:hypothetical protein FQN60_015673, partial [Etheostoma spectabile]
MMGALSVVSQLRDLASEPQNREVIVQDQGCLPGLVLFLDHQNPDVLLATLQTLRYLAELSPNISTMKNELALAKEVFDILSAPANPVPRTPERERRKKSQFFINSTNKKAKSVTLHIQGLDSTSPSIIKDQRGLCEEALLKVRGVISFTFQMASKRCTVRIRSDLPTEVFIPLNPCGREVPQNSALPDYLPEEEESPEREVDRAVSRTKAKEDSNGSWLNAAAGFLTKTFYWTFTSEPALVGMIECSRGWLSAVVLGFGLASGWRPLLLCVGDTVTSDGLGVAGVPDDERKPDGARPAYLRCSSCCLRSSSSRSLCSRASRRFSVRIRLASSGSVGLRARLRGTEDLLVLLPFLGSGGLGALRRDPVQVADMTHLCVASGPPASSRGGRRDPPPAEVPLLAAAVRKWLGLQGFEGHGAHGTDSWHCGYE